MLQNLFITIQTETKPESQPYLPLSIRQRHVTSSAIPRAARRTYVFLTSPHLTSPPPKPLPFSCSFSRLLPPQLLSPPPPPLLHASSTTPKQELEKKYERFSSPTNAVLIRMGSTDRKVRACARAALSVVSLACVI